MGLESRRSVLLQKWHDDQSAFTVITLQHMCVCVLMFDIPNRHEIKHNPHTPYRTSDSMCGPGVCCRFDWRAKRSAADAERKSLLSSLPLARAETLGRAQAPTWRFVAVRFDSR